MLFRRALYLTLPVHTAHTHDDAGTCHCHRHSPTLLTRRMKALSAHSTVREALLMLQMDSKCKTPTMLVHDVHLCTSQA